MFFPDEGGGGGFDIFPAEGGGGGGLVLFPVVAGGGGREGRDFGGLLRLLSTSSSVSLKFVL